MLLRLEEEGHLGGREGAQSFAMVEEQRSLEAVVEAVRSDGRLCNPDGVHDQVAVRQPPIGQFNINPDKLMVYAHRAREGSSVFSKEKVEKRLDSLVGAPACRNYGRAQVESTNQANATENPTPVTR